MPRPPSTSRPSPAPGAPVAGPRRVPDPVGHPAQGSRATGVHHGPEPVRGALRHAPGMTGIRGSALWTRAKIRCVG
ncbi:hypothetical protein GCM10023329_03840 [Streptomyces sanyensis]|uniref:Uncharacterized protein n=1 Tax=Streptomyces sanyensis TaxID=568869 RepID=A0ABP8ZP96_9ACTN